MTDRALPNPFILLKMIFDYWKQWLENSSEDALKFANYGQDDAIKGKDPIWGEYEGLVWHDGHNATFWYLLNVSWYEMNDKLYAYTGCNQPFDCNLRDFDPEYLAEYYS